MSDHGSASLHAGLIERARPRKRMPVPEGVVPFPSPRQGRNSAPLEPLDMRALLAERFAEDPGHDRRVPRRGLTVRVEPELYTALQRLRKRGRTAQSVLHDALVRYLAN